MSLEFLNPGFLFAAAGAAAPVLVHLVFRRRAVQVDFSSVRFLKLVDLRLARNRRLREILVLVLRTSAVLLCAAALARPVLRPEGAGGSPGGSTSLAVILDSSASMRAGSAGRTAFDEAAAAARSALAALESGDEAVIMFPGSPAKEEAGPSRFVEDARAELASASCGFGRAALCRAAREAAAAISKSRSANKEILLITDLRASSFEEDGGGGSLPEGVRLFVADAACESGSNLSPVSARILNPPVIAGIPAEFSVIVRNHGTAEERGKAVLRIDGSEFGGGEFRIGPGQTAEMAFSRVFDKPGFHRVTFAAGGDAFRADDEFHMAVEAGSRVQVLVVNGSPSGHPFLDETFYIKAALDLGNEQAGGPQSCFDPVFLSEAELESADPAGFRAVILANVRSLGLRAAAGLRSFVENGGGILVFHGDRTAAGAGAAGGPAARNPPLAADCAGLESPQEQVRLAEVDFASDVFEPFKSEANMDFKEAVFSRYVLLKPAQGAKIIASFSDGAPAVVERSEGKGRIIQFASSCDLDWGNLPTRTVFLPMLYRMLCLLARVEGTGGLAGIVGERPPAAAIPAGTALGDLILSAPSGSRRAPSAGPGGTILLPEFDEPGFHWLESPGPGSGFKRLFAANIDPGESALERASVDRVSALLGTRAIPIERLSDAGTEMLSYRKGDEIGAFLLVAALALMLVEVFLANRPLHGNRGNKVTS